MKRYIALLLILVVLLSGCASTEQSPVSNAGTDTVDRSGVLPSNEQEEADTAEPGPGAGVEISCISFNVLSYDTHDSGYALPEERAQLVVRFLREQNADLVGLQEVTDAHGYDWVTTLREGLSDIYECRILNDEEYCPISNMRIGSGLMFLYRKDRFDYVASDCYDYRNDADRYYHWVKLYDNQAGREVFFSNTHFSINGGDAEDGNYKRCGEAEELVELWKTECKDLALFATGDYNCYSFTEPHQDYLMSDIYQPSADVAIEGEGSGGIDFCYVNPKATDVLKHEVLDKKYVDDSGLTVDMSDHSPILTVAVYK